MPRGVRKVTKTTGTAMNRDSIRTEIARSFTSRDLAMIEFGRTLFLDNSKSNVYPLASTQDGLTKSVVRRGRPRVNQAQQNQVA